MRKLIPVVMALVLAGSTMAFTSCKKQDNVTPQTNTGGTTTTPATATDYEKQVLTFTREEEKMARDVYTELLSKWGLSFFSNISGSEQKHMDAVKNLLDTYGLQDPVGSNAAGVFTNTDVQKLYNDLVAKGQMSEMDAIIVGLTIEDMDIYDIEQAIDKVTGADIKNVLSNLVRGSKNHMREFYAQMKSRGGTYTPQYITQEHFDEIVNSPKEHGGN